MINFSIPRKHRGKLDSNRFLLAFQRTAEKFGNPTQEAVTLKITDNAAIRKLNKSYRGMDDSTDVLSFENDYIDLETGSRFIGDIVISIETAEFQAGERGFSLQQEMEMLFVHALLHLYGYDHMEEADLEDMSALQDEILKEIDNPVLGSISRE